MAKKYLLHRITEEDAEYIAEETGARYNEINDGNCYCLINKDNGKILRDEEQLLIYKASGIMTGTIDEDKRKFLEAIEACAFFRGYANFQDIKYKNPKVVELLYKLEDHEIEVPNGCREYQIIYSSHIIQNEEIRQYIMQSSNAYDNLIQIERNLPTLALFISEPLLNQLSREDEEEYEDEIEEDEDEIEEDELNDIWTDDIF